METITTIVTTWVSNPDNQQLIFLMMVGASIAIFAMGISAVFVGNTNPVKKRMGVELKSRAEEDASEGTARRLVDIPTLMGPVAQWLIPSSDIELSETTKKLSRSMGSSPLFLRCTSRKLRSRE